MTKKNFKHTKHTILMYHAPQLLKDRSSRRASLRSKNARDDRLRRCLPFDVRVLTRIFTRSHGAFWPDLEISDRCKPRGDPVYVAAEENICQKSAKQTLVENMQTK